MGRFSGRSLEVTAHNTRIEPQGCLPRIGHEAFPFWQRITAKFVVSRFPVQSIILADLLGNTCLLVTGEFDPLCLSLCLSVRCL